MDEMDAPDVVFPEVDGRRSTSALGRAVVGDALRTVDPVGARAAEHETNWRSGYVDHFRRAVEAGLLSADAALRVAADGAASVHRRMRWRTGNAQEVPLGEALTGQADATPLETATVAGRGEAERGLSLPLRGRRLRGDDLMRQLDAWVRSGAIEASCAEAVRAVAANPDWLDLSDLRLVVVGAAAEMGPLQAVLRWGGDVVAVDLPRPDLWAPVLELAQRLAGRMHIPVRAVHGGAPADDVAERAGVDVVGELPLAAQWLQDVAGPVVLGNYVYADGAANVRVASAVDALTVHLQARRDDLALAFLATPTDVFVVPPDAVADSQRAYDQRSRTARLLGRPLRTLSAGRLLQRHYIGHPDPGISDALIPQQGPNYALAKRLQRWRAAVARSEGVTVSLNVAPPTRTRSVVKNRVLAAAYAGAHRFGVEVFEPSTSNTLMAALLVHDLRTGGATRHHPWQHEAAQAAHGGLWRSPYDPRSVLGLAALLGLGGSRT